MRKIIFCFQFFEFKKLKIFFSHAIIADRTVYVSGCLGLDKDTLKLVPGGAGPEMRKALENMIAILESAGSSVEKVVKATIFVTDLKDFPAVNEEYRKGLLSVQLAFALDFCVAFCSFHPLSIVTIQRAFCRPLTGPLSVHTAL